MSYADHDHRGDYAEPNHTHDRHDVYDVAGDDHDHNDLRHDIQLVRDEMRELGDALRGELEQMRGQIDRINRLARDVRSAAPR